MSPWSVVAPPHIRWRGCRRGPGPAPQGDELDPASSYAHSLLALSHFHDALADWTKDPPRALTATLLAARRAVELDDDDGCLTRSSVSPFSGPAATTTGLWKRCSARLRSILAVIAYQFLGCVAVFAGRPAQAVSALETVLQLDPQYQSRSLILADLSLSRLLLDDVDRAVSTATDAVHRDPENVRAYQRLVAALGHTAREAEARAALATLSHLQPNSLKRTSAPPIISVRRALALFNEGLRSAGWKGTFR